MKITVEEKLGAWVAYGKDEVRVLKDFSDKVPQELRSDFESVLVESCNQYHQSVEEAKARGERPKSAFLKKKAFDSVREWVRKQGFMKSERVIVSKKPRIPTDNEVPRVVQKNYIEDINPSQEEISSLFSNFDSESLQDDSIVEESSVDTGVVNLDDDLFEGIDLLDGLDDF